MARNTHLSESAINLQADALAALLDGGYLRLYTGAQPADPDTAIGSQVKLAELRIGSPAFGSAAAGVITANALTADEDAAATGLATWYRAFAADGTTAIIDGSVGRNGTPGAGDTYNLNFSAPNIQEHAKVSISGWTHAVPE